MSGMLRAPWSTRRSSAQASSWCSRISPAPTSEHRLHQHRRVLGRHTSARGAPAARPPREPPPSFGAIPLPSPPKQRPGRSRRRHTDGSHRRSLRSTRNRPRRAMHHSSTRSCTSPQLSTHMRLRRHGVWRGVARRCCWRIAGKPTASAGALVAPRSCSRIGSHIAACTGGRANPIGWRLGRRPFVDEAARAGEGEAGEAAVGAV
jgi:hypothetical protein